MKIPGLLKIKKLPNADCCTVLALGCVFGALCTIGVLPLWIVLLAAAAGVIWLKLRPALFLNCGIAAALLSGMFWSGNEAERRQEYSGSEQASGIVIIRDSRATRVKDIVLQSRVRAEFIAEGRAGSCPVLLKVPDKIRESGFLYGDRLQVRGILSVPQTSGFYFDGKNIGDAVPPPYGTACLFEALEVKNLPSEKSFKRNCFSWREVLLKKLIRRMNNKSKSMAARLFLGASDGAPPEVKRNFVLAGIIHLFAVSGMHVAVLAAVVGAGLVLVPFRIRYLLLAAVTFLYVLCSGMAVPAMRAGAMIIVWALLRSLLYHTPNWNVLMFSLSVLCICDPAGITELGTQYSYGITAALIAGLSLWHRWRSGGREVDALMINSSPFTKEQRKQERRVRDWAIFAAVAVLAFAAGAMLTMLHQKYFLPGSILSNMAAALLTPLMFVVFIFKVLIGFWFDFADQGGAWLIDCGFDYLRAVSGLSLEIFPPIASGRPGALAVGLFYLLFFAGLTLKNFYAALVSMVLAISLMFSFPLMNKYRPETLIVLAGSSEHVPLIGYLIPQEERAVICNLPDSWSGSLAADELLRNGCLRAELYFSGGYSGNSAGVKSFASRIAVKRINLPDSKHTPYFLRHLSDRNVALPVPEKFPERRRQAVPGKGKDFQWSFAEGHTVTASAADDGWKICWQKPDDSRTETVIPYSNHALLWKSQKKAIFKAGND